MPIQRSIPTGALAYWVPADRCRRSLILAGRYRRTASRVAPARVWFVVRRSCRIDRRAKHHGAGCGGGKCTSCVVFPPRHRAAWPHLLAVAATRGACECRPVSPAHHWRNLEARRGARDRRAGGARRKAARTNLGITRPAQGDAPRTAAGRQMDRGIRIALGIGEDDAFPTGMWLCCARQDAPTSCPI